MYLRYPGSSVMEIWQYWTELGDFLLGFVEVEDLILVFLPVSDLPASATDQLYFVVELCQLKHRQFYGALSVRLAGSSIH